MSLSLIKNGIEVITLDVTSTYVHKYPSKVTSFPVETGSTITDNVVNEQFSLDVEGLVSEDSSGFLLFNFDPNKVRSAFDALVNLRNSRSPFTVVTTLKSYDNMLFTNLEFTINSESGYALPITMSFAQAQFVSAQNVDIPAAKSSNDVKDKSSKKSDYGSQPNATVPPSQIIDMATNNNVNVDTIVK